MGLVTGHKVIRQYKQELGYEKPGYNFQLNMADGAHPLIFVFPRHLTIMKIKRVDQLKD